MRVLVNNLGHSIIVPTKTPDKKPEVYSNEYEYIASDSSTSKQPTMGDFVVYLFFNLFPVLL